MFVLNYTADIEEMSEEARHLANNGIVILKCYRGVKGIILKVNTRAEFDEACGLCEWYAKERGLGRVVTINIDDFVLRGDLTFLIVG